MDPPDLSGPGRIRHGWPPRLFRSVTRKVTEN